MESEIVITGMSGRFPESDSVAEFSDNLYNKVDLVTEDNRRWEPGLYGVPKRLGKLKDVSKFDNQFFGVHHKQAHFLDPQARILLELTYESIVDAGYDPDKLRGRKIGVFIGSSISESEEYFSIHYKECSGYTMTGSCKAMFANRISYTFDFKGPSCAVDAACSSSAFALCEAVTAIRRGECEAAIVGGANLCLRPTTSLAFHLLNMLSPDGMSKSFDASGDGYARSEAVCTLFIQRADVALRKYATIVHIKTNTDGFKEDGITFPSTEMQKRLITEVYDECKLDPLEVSYIEAHGTGTPVGDLVEMSTIANTFCKRKKEKLLVGSVKSNMGHSEASSGICGIIKILISMEKGLIPPNLHFNSPCPEIEALMEGQVEIVTSPTLWKGGYAAFNSFGFGGVNVHGILQSNPFTQQLKIKTDEVVPQLVLYSGRTAESVQTLFDYLDKNETPREFFALLHKSAYTSPRKNPFRGFKLLTGKETVADIKQPPAEKRPLWYIFSGIGTQWPCMAKRLMHLELFANSIRKSASVLESYGIDLIDLVTNDVRDTSNARSIIPAFVCIAAVQVALVDVLNELGLKPDGIVGHSVGELGCAYADGCFTAEQMLLAAYWRGKAVEDSNLQEGAMAALGITWSQAVKRCPKDIYPSCHNAEDSVTISGPTNSVKDFVEVLKTEYIFAREVDSCGYAFHCQYILPAAGKLQTALEKIIPDPKPRTSRWVSSSYSKDKWNSPESKIADASYFVHNLVQPVLFCEALHYVPKNAIVLEIGPHHLLQAILKREIGPNAEYIGLMKRNVDNAVHLMSSIGRLYTTGLNPDIEKLYPAVQFPVPKNTPMISPLIKWDHSEKWTVAKWDNVRLSQMVVKVNPGPQDSPDHYVLGHCIDGRYLYPATGYIVLVWKAFAEIKNKEMTALPVTFEDIKIHRATLLCENAVTNFTVEVTSYGGEFEISENGMIVCTGRVYTPENAGSSCVETKVKTEMKTLTLNHIDIYKELKLRGYNYGPTFQGVISADAGGNQGLLKWTGDWVVFLDTMVQFSGLAMNNRLLFLPTGIEKLSIDPIVHNKIAEECLKENGGVPAIYEKLTGQYFAGGVQIKHLKASLISRERCKQFPILEKYQFIPYNESCILSKTKKEFYDRYIRVCSSVSKMILKLSGKYEDIITNAKNEFQEEDEDVIANYLKSYTDEHVLLKSLCGIMNTATTNDLTSHVKNYANSYLSEREKDILSQTMLSEVPLRNVIDVVLENTASRKLKIAEVTEDSMPLSSKISKYIQILGFLSANYSIVHSNPEVLDKEYLQINAEVISWDYKSAFDLKEIDLFVLKYLSCSEKEFKRILKNSIASVRSDGFIAVLHRTYSVPAEKFLSAVSETIIPTLSENDLEQIFKELNLRTISKKSDSLASTLYLLRKTPSATFEESVIYITVDEHEKWTDPLRAKMFESRNSSAFKRIWLVSEGSNHSGIVGLVNCLRQEPGGSSVRCVFTGQEAPNVPKFSLTSPFYKGVLEKNLVMNVFKKGSWGSYRHILCKEDCAKVETDHAYLNILTRGDLSSLVWVHSPLKYFAPSEKAIMCQVYYAALNFRDIMLASGKLPSNAIKGHLALQESLLGFEFSGRTMDGQRVMGIVTQKGIATTVVADPFMVLVVPDKWTLEEASTIPVAYCTAYYALIVRGNLKKGERILIHSGSGGVGQAAIAIALSMGCEVFTSVGTAEKREFLQKRFPQLKDCNFCNSRDTSFEQKVLKQTNGKGVDAVLNSLADEKFKAGLNCLAVHGRFLEIGKYDLSNNTLLGTSVFLKDIAFHGICLDALFGDTRIREPIMQEVLDLVKKGIADGVVKPLNTTIFNHDQAEQAFRYMASGRHIGKVEIKIKEEEQQKQITPSPVRFTAITRTAFNPRKTYVIIGGLGGFGLELCQWLVERGARNIVLTSRSGIKSGYQQLCLDRWTKTHEANVMPSKLNATRLDEARKLLEIAVKHGPIGGIFNLALVLRDALMENQTVQNFIEVCESKVLSTIYMDALSRELCPELDWFVCFSSAASGRGNVGQSNYGYANSVMERICEERSEEGLPGLAIQWGAIGDVGVTQDTLGSDAIVGATVSQRINSCLAVFDHFLQQSTPVVSSFVPLQISEVSTQKSSKHRILSSVANIFGIKDITSINPEKNLGELGMDSLMGIELQQFLERDFELTLSIPELRQLKIKDLKKIEVEAVGIKASTAKVAESETPLVDKVSENFNTLLSKLLPTETLVHMNSVDNGTPLFVVHSIEGSVAMLDSLVQLIPYPVYGLQFTQEAPYDSIEDLAAWYWKNIKALDSPTKTINLAGYSFGAAVVFEMALQADRDPKQYLKVDSLILLDCSPEFLSTYTREYESHFKKNNQLEDHAFTLVPFEYYITESSEVQKNELLKLPSYEGRVEYTVEKIVSACPYLKIEDVKTAFDLYYKRVIISLKYTPKCKLKRDLTLIKASENLCNRKTLSDVYDLDKVCEGKITAHTVKGTHSTFIQGEGAKEVGTIIREILNH